MATFLCWLWTFLFGGLTGWFLCGLLARRLKYAQRPIQQIIANKPVNVNTTDADKTADVEKIIEIDNPAHLKRIAELEASLNESNALVPKLRNDIDELKRQLRDVKDSSSSSSTGTPNSNSNDNADDNSLTSAAALGLSATGAGIVSGEDDTDKKYSLGLLDSSTGKTMLDSDLANVTSMTTEFDQSAAKAAGFNIKKDNDFTVVEGIGPKINQLLHEASIISYQQLSNTTVDTIQKILNDAGSRFSLAKPGTWPKQAAYAANNQWIELKKWQDELDGGV